MNTNPEQSTGHCPIALALVVACVVASSAIGQAGLPLPEPGVPQSCGVQLKNHNFTLETISQVHKLGLRVIRRGFYWDIVEKEKGVYDFSGCDAQMQHARQLGMTVVGCLFGNNKLYEDDGQGGIQTEAGRQGFASFAAALARRYQDHRVLWEVWNEPNVRTFWRKNGKHNSEEFADEYTRLVQAVAAAMLEADPQCFLVAGSVSNYWEPSYEWTESCFKRGILKSGIRGWSVHPYGVKTPEEFAIGHKRTRELLTKYGQPEFPLLDTERGFAVKETAEGWSGGSKERALEFQAWNLVRQFLNDQMHGIALTIWYEWDGDGFGIGEEDGSRPAYAACKVMLEQLGGYRFVRRVQADQELDYVVLFENAAGQRKLAAWTAPPPGGAPDEAREHVVAVEIVGPQAFDIVGLRGEASQAPMVIGALRLTLRGAPQYVTVPDGVELGGCAALGAPRMARSAAPQPGAAPEPPAAGTDQNLFDGKTEWTFVKNTGDGSFELGTDGDGTPIGILHYDFTKSKSRSTPYVLASAPVSIPSGATAVRIGARSSMPQKLTFRVVDSTGQTHQYKGRVKGTGQWETIRIPLTGRLEHWGGAADGKIHYPVTTIVFSLPLPGADARTGKVEYGYVAVER